MNHNPLKSNDGTPRIKGSNHCETPKTSAINIHFIPFEHDFILPKQKCYPQHIPGYRIIVPNHPMPMPRWKIYILSKLLLVKLDNAQININPQTKQHTNIPTPQNPAFTMCFEWMWEFLLGEIVDCRGNYEAKGVPENEAGVSPNVPPLSCESPRIPDRENGRTMKRNQNKS